MSRPNVYKKLDIGDRLLAALWEMFPVITAKQISVDEMNKKIEINMAKNSSEYCSLLEKKLFQLFTFAEGGFGEVAVPILKEDDVKQGENLYAITISLGQGGGFAPFYMPVIVKRGKTPKKLVMDVKQKTMGGKLRTFITINDPYSEIIIGAVMTHVYDLSVCPFFSRYFGGYTCKKVSMPVEKADTEMRKLLTRKTRSKNGLVSSIHFKHMLSTPEALTNILFQYAYTMFVGKYYAGFAHYDSHIRNVMVSFTKGIFAKEKGYIYGAKDLSKKDYYAINTGFKSNGKPEVIAFRNNGMMLKLIDYGLASNVFMYSEYTSFKGEDQINLTVSDKDFQDIKGGLNALTDALNSKSKFNTAEIQFLLLNLYSFMSLGVDGYGVADEYSPLIEQLLTFSEHFFSDSYYRTDLWLRAHPDYKVPMSPNGTYNIYGQSRRDTGLEIPGWENTTNILRGLANVCLQKGHRAELADVVYYYLEDDIDVRALTKENTFVLDYTNPTKSRNDLDRFIREQKKVVVNCKNRGENVQQCVNVNKRYVGMFDPNNKIKERIYSRIQGTRLHKALMSSENKITPSSDLTDYQRTTNDKYRVYTIEINPRALLLPVTGEGALIYQPYHKWFDFKRVSQDKPGHYIETVHLNIIELPKGYESRIQHNETVWNTAATGVLSAIGGVAVSGNYFIVPKSVSPLTMSIPTVYGVADIVTKEYFDKRYPIGYVYDTHNLERSGTFLPVPRPYRKYFAAVYYNKKSGLNVVPYNDFLYSHVTQTTPLLYRLESGRIYATTQETIYIHPDTGKPILVVDGNGSKMEQEKTVSDDDYEYAFATGPILVYNGEVVFTRDIMLNREFKITEEDQPYDEFVAASPVYQTDMPPIGTKYALAYTAKSNKMFISTEQDGSNQIYGMRHSERFMNHNILVKTRNGTIYNVFIEGRGYNAPGLDRVQAAHLVNTIKDVEIAVSLDGGFTANACITNKGKTLTLIDNPEDRRLGIVSMFAYP